MDNTNTEANQPAEAPVEAAPTGEVSPDATPAQEETAPAQEEPATAAVDPSEPAKNYIGTKVIMSVEETDIKTFLGNKMVKIRFEDGMTNILPEKVYLTAVTNSPIDATALQEKMCSPIAAEIIALMTEASVTVTDAGHVIDLVVNSLQQSTNDAAKKLFGVEYLENRTLMSVDSILKGNGPTNY